MNKKDIITKKITKRKNLKRWLKKHYIFLRRHVKQDYQYPYTINDVFLDAETSKLMVRIKLCGRAGFKKFTLEHLLKDDQLLGGLPPSNIKLLIQFSIMEGKLPKYEIVSQIFAIEADDSEVFIIRDNSNNECYKVATTQVMRDAMILENLSKKDLLRIAFSYHQMLINRDKQTLDRYRRENFTVVRNHPQYTSIMHHD